MQNEKEEKEKKAYVKPQIEKHKAISIISGSGGGCSFYNSRTRNSVYYH
jgi:hypothetical protein